MAVRRISFPFYRDWADAMKCYPIELKSEIFDAIVDLALDNEEKEDLSEAARMIFAVFRPKIQRDAARYQAACERNKRNGVKGGRPRKQIEDEEPTGLEENPKNPLGSEEPTGGEKTQPNPKNPTEPDNDNDNEKEYDKEYEYGNNDNDINIILSKDSNSTSVEWVAAFFKQETGKYNSNFPKLRNIKGVRLNHVKARLREYGEDAVREVITKAAQSDFLNGKNDRGWLANFDWIFLPTNFLKVLEGNYDNQTTTSNSQGSIFFRTGADGRDQRAADYAQRIARLAAEDDARQAEVRKP